MSMQVLNQYLEQAHVAYQTHKHPTAFTALEVAERAHVKGRSLAKTVIVKVDGRLAMIVMPATHIINMQTLPVEMNCEDLELALEYEFQNLFADCETGAMPPFGNLFSMEVYMDQAMAENDTISFTAGEHNEILEISFTDFHTLVQPKLLQHGFIPLGQSRPHEHPRMGRTRH